jgi:DNA-binding CsgD family transcriptional regulator
MPKSAPALRRLKLAGRTPFVGRERELAALTVRLESAARGEGGVVLVSGEPGIGKSRLLLEIQARAEATGWLVLSGRSYDTEGMPPYLPFAEAIAQYLRTAADKEAGARLAEAAPEVALLVPELRNHVPDGAPHPSIGPEATRYRLFEAVSDFFLDLAGRGETTGLLLCLDDLHWADRSTLLLFQHLARRLRSARLLVVCAFRTEEVDRSRPLFDVLAELAREQQDQRLPLARLSADETGALVASLSGATPVASLVHAIHHQTEGNPFFVQEVVRHLESQEDGFAGAEARPGDWGLSQGVHDVIGRRLSRLGVETQRLLECAAVLGDGFDTALLRAMEGAEGATVTPALDESVQTAMLREQGSSYVFGHPLIRQVIYEGLSLSRKQALHLRAAEATETNHAGRLEPHLAALATHYRLACAEARKALLYSKLAAEQAEAATAWDEASRHYEACLTLLTASRGVSGEDEGALLVALGRCQRNDAQSRPAWRSLMRAMSIYRERGDGRGVARAALEASASAMLTGERFVALIDEALNALGESDPRLQAQLLLVRAGWEFDNASNAATAEAARIANTLDDVALRGDLANREAFRAAQEKRLGDTVSLSRRAHALLDEGGERQKAADTLCVAAAWILFEGKLDEGIAAVNDALTYARKYHVRPAELNCLASLQAAALIRCDFLQFDSLLKGAAGTRDAAEAGHLVAVVCAARLEMSGDTDGALELLPPPDAPVEADLRAHLLGSLARTSFNAGYEDQARMYLEEWSRELSRMSPTHIAFRPYAIAELDECLSALGDEALVRRVYEELNEWKILRYSPPDGRGFDHIRGALALRLERIDEAEGWYRIGLEWAERARCPVEVGRCLHGLAEVAIHRRRRGEALRLLDEASVLFDAHGARLYLDRAYAARAALVASARGPIRPVRATNPGGLTAREVEVLRLIAEGKSNREIGAELVLSLRTVERHIVNIYNKLDVHSKAQATAYAFTHELAPPPR